MEIVVTINGTDVNPWHRMNLRQNPFPQIPKAELSGAMQQLNSLDADPIRGPDDIRERLAGWSEEFVQACIASYKPGERTRFRVTFPDGP